MDCNIVRDLLPLYVDDCCSEESRKTVEEHLDKCPECKKISEAMLVPAEISNDVTTVSMPKKISEWKASVFQSILLFISFGLITFGVAKEASTPTGLMNGFWAWELVVPATGFMLSLANWYFVRLYKSRKLFSTFSCLITLGITVAAYIWSFSHYEMNISDVAFLIESILLENTGLGAVLHFVTLFFFWFGGSTITIILSKILSSVYAKMLGKE